MCLSCQMSWRWLQYIFSWSDTGLFGRMVSSIQNGTFSRTSYVPCAGSALFVRFSFCIRSLVIIPLQDITTITGDFVSAGINPFLATKIFAISYAPRLHAIFHSMLDVLNRSLSLPKIAIGAKCIGKHSLSLGIFPLCSGQWMLSLISYWLLRSRKCETMCVLVYFPSSPSMGQFLVLRSSLLFPFRAWMHLDA